MTALAAATVTATPEGILSLVIRIVETCRPRRIVLFGSYAYGHPTADSDVDLLIEMPHEGKGWHTASAIRREVKAEFPVDYLVRSSEELAQRIAFGDCFLKEIVTKGKVLYVAPDAAVMERALDPGERHSPKGDAVLERNEVLAILSAFRSALGRHGAPDARLVLYGSYAKGNARPESAIDVVVVAEAFEGKPFFDRVEILAQATMEVWGEPIQAVALTPREWENGESVVVEYARNGIEVQ